jgi:hypothetical protein
MGWVEQFSMVAMSRALSAAAPRLRTISKAAFTMTSFDILTLGGIMYLRKITDDI